MGSASIYKVSVYLVDAGNQYEYYNKEEFKSFLESLIEDHSEMFTHHLRVEQRTIETWDDDLPINFKNCPEEECEKYFT